MGMQMARTKVAETGDMYPLEKHWHVTRGIPIALIFSMAIFFVTQTGTAAWFAARIESRVAELEKAQVLAAPQADRLTRVEEKLGNVKDSITDLKTGISDIKLILQTADNHKPTR